MVRTRYVPVMLAVAGCAAIVLGIFQGLVHVAPGYEGTITTGWDGPLSRQEVLLGLLGAGGVGGTIAAHRWKRLAGVPVAVGGVVLFYTARAVYGQFRARRPLYREFHIYGGGFDGEPIMFILGLEPFLLAGGGILLIGAGLAGWNTRHASDERDETAASSSTA